MIDRISGTVYIDPPYANTAGYAAAPPHDPVQFVRAVFVSEYQAPAHWEECARWEGQKAINRGTRIERLFTRA